MTKAIFVGSALMMLTGCAAMAEPSRGIPGEPLRLPPGQCDASAAQSYVGKAATQDAGEAIREVTAARTLRWGPPDTAWTMDYRDDRVNVRYDNDMIITSFRVGRRRQ